MDRKLRIPVFWIGAFSIALLFVRTGYAQPIPWQSQDVRTDRYPDQGGLRFAQASRLPASPETHVDFDAYLENRGALDATPAEFTTPGEEITPYREYHVGGAAVWQLLPEGLVYDTYLAGTQEPRFALQMLDINSRGVHFEGFLGARVPILRYGTTNSVRPEGFQVDAEGLARVRIDLADDWVVDAADFRGGVPLSYGYGRHRTKLGYYHLSSHLQDEFLAANAGYPRVNFSRDVFILGHAYYVTDRVRLYGEVGYGFITDVSEPWEFQVGFDYAPCGPTGIHGAPFFAMNAHFREEVNYAGALTVQLGWAWIGDSGKLLRTGLHYYTGKSNQYSFYDDYEQQIGFGLWYDFW